jgi:hypothetical protein
MSITIFKHLSEADLDKTVWRYLTFPKFISLLTYRALWFSKLNSLVDKYEGSMPTTTGRVMWENLQRTVPAYLLPYLDSLDRNVDDGRELTLVNCWFLSDRESEDMWGEYASGIEGVAIKSTVRALSQYVFCDPQFSSIGKVQYVDLESHEMSFYEANQAHERAFLKRLEYSHEQEIRITTMSIRGPMCVNMDGTFPAPAEYEGPKMNNFENPGLYIQVDLGRLITATVLAPGAKKWFELLVKRIVHLSGLGSPLLRSALE